MTTDKITHAILSVSDKTGIVPFASILSQLQITILSTGGTAKLLKKHHIPVVDIADFTGFPEMLGGRVKTLHPKLYGGILARGEIDQEMLLANRIPFIGLVVVNLYPFMKVISEGCDQDIAIENIDIGGPTLLRAAAKNYQYTTAIVAPEDYDLVLAELNQSQQTSEQTRLKLAKKVFAHVANYDAAISNYFSTMGEDDIGFPETYTLQLHKKMALRYGENPHQNAAFYTVLESLNLASISHAIQLSGKPLSYNNIADADTALACVQQFQAPACVIVKHANPCAVAVGDNPLQAYQKAFAADSTSAYGGILAFNRSLDETVLETIISTQFVEVILAPEISTEALALAKQKPNIRVLSVGEGEQVPGILPWEFKSVNGGGILVQENDVLSSPTLDTVSDRHPTEKELKDLLFAWQVVRFVKSNAIVYAKDQVTYGIGTGQMSRVFSAQIATLKAKEAGFSLKNAVMASDAFFPFRDSIDEAAQLGLSAIIQPGGSIRDEEVICAANEHNIAMVFTHQRHFRH